MNISCITKSYHGVGLRSPKCPFDNAFRSDVIGAANMAEAIMVPKLGQTYCINISLKVNCIGYYDLLLLLMLWKSCCCCGKFLLLLSVAVAVVVFDRSPFCWCFFFFFTFCDRKCFGVLFNGYLREACVE